MSNPSEQELLARIDERLHNFTERFDAHIEHCHKRQEDWEGRLKLVEEWKAKSIGMVAGVVAIVTIAVNLLSKLFH